MFFTSFFGLFILILSSFKKPFKPIKTSNPKDIKKANRMLIFRGIMGFLATSTFFYNIHTMPFVNTVIFMQSAVLFSSVFMFILFRENLSILQWGSVFIGFIGVLLMVQVDESFFNNWTGVLCGITSALAYMSIRELRRYYESRVIVLVFLLVNMFGSIICMILGSYMHIESMNFLFVSFIMPDSLLLFALLIMIAFFSMLSQIFKTKAYANAKAGIVGVIWYIRVPITMFIGVEFLGDSFPNIIVLTGILLITLSCIVVSLEKK